MRPTPEEVWWAERFAEALVVLVIVCLVAWGMVESQRTPEIEEPLPTIEVTSPCEEAMRHPGREGYEVVVLVCPVDGGTG